MYKFYLCNECKEVVVLNANSDAGCCFGETMTLLVANTVDAAKEKHVPCVTRNGNELDVQVGSVMHPMDADHFITMVAVVQGDKLQMVSLKPGVEPKAHFVVADGPVSVYEYCNKHGLWLVEA